MADQLDFVNSIGDPTVRFNVADGSTWRVTRDGTRFDPPPLRRARRGGTMLTDGEPTSSSVYGNRTLFIRLVLQAGTADTLAAAYQALARELDRERSTIRWWPDGATNPVYFRTYRAAGGSVENIRAGADFIDLEIEAEPFAYGTKQTLGPFTVNNDPAAASNALSFDVTGVLGDVDTPVQFLASTTDVVVTGRRKSVFAVRRSSGQLPVAAFVLQAEGMTRHASTTLPGNDATMSGAGSNYARSASLTSSFVTRLTSSTHPNPSGAHLRGTYRVFARGRQNTASDEIRLRLDSGVLGDPIIWPSGSTARRWVDLGLAQLPVGPDPTADSLTGATLSCAGINWSVAIAQTSGTGTFDLDCLIFMPADDAMAVVWWPGGISGGMSTMVLDTAADDPVVYGLDVANAVYSVDLPELDCGQVRVSPGLTNRIFFLLDAGRTVPGGDDKTETTAITVAYLPRYLRVRPAST